MSLNINNSYSVLTPGATGGDVQVIGTDLKITGCPIMDIRRIIDPIVSSTIAPIAETLSVWTVTVPASPTAGLRDAFLISQTVRGSTTALPGLPQTLWQDSLAAVANHDVQTGDSNVNVAAGLLSSLKGYQDPAVGFQFTASAPSNVITITALAGYPLINIIDQSPAVNALTLNNSTPGVASRGTYTDLIHAGVDPTLLSTSTVYGQVVFNFIQTMQTRGVLPSDHLYSHTLYVDKTSSNTNYTNFFTALATALGALYI